MALSPKLASPFQTIRTAQPRLIAHELVWLPFPDPLNEYSSCAESLRFGSLAKMDWEQTQMLVQVAVEIASWLSKIGFVGRIVDQNHHYQASL